MGYDAAKYAIDEIVEARQKDFRSGDQPIINFLWGATINGSNVKFRIRGIGNLNTKTQTGYPFREGLDKANGHILYKEIHILFKYNETDYNFESIQDADYDKVISWKEYKDVQYPDLEFDVTNVSEYVVQVVPVNFNGIASFSDPARNITNGVQVLGFKQTFDAFDSFENIEYVRDAREMVPLSFTLETAKTGDAINNWTSRWNWLKKCMPYHLTDGNGTGVYSKLANNPTDPLPYSSLSSSDAGINKVSFPNTFYTWIPALWIKEDYFTPETSRFPTQRTVLFTDNVEYAKKHGFWNPGFRLPAGMGTADTKGLWLPMFGTDINGITAINRNRIYGLDTSKAVNDSWTNSGKNLNRVWFGGGIANMFRDIFILMAHDIDLENEFINNAHWQDPKLEIPNDKTPHGNTFMFDSSDDNGAPGLAFWSNIWGGIMGQMRDPYIRFKAGTFKYTTDYTFVSDEIDPTDQSHWKTVQAAGNWPAKTWIYNNRMLYLGDGVGSVPDLRITHVNQPMADPKDGTGEMLNQNFTGQYTLNANYDPMTGVLETGGTTMITRGVDKNQGFASSPISVSYAKHYGKDDNNNTEISGAMMIIPTDPNYQPRGL